MKVLLDENLPHRLRQALHPHEVFTVRYQGWSGLRNGELLRIAEAHHFAALLTGDQGIPYEQSVANLQIAVLVLSAIEWRIIQPNVSVIQAALALAQPGSFQFVDIGTFGQ